MFRSQQAALGCISHIHKIIPSADTYWQLASQIVNNQLIQMVTTCVTRADNTGRMNYHGGQALARSIQYQLGSLRLGLGIATSHQIWRKMFRFPNDAASRRFLNGMD